MFTQLSDVSNQVQTFWSGMFMDELKENSILPALVSKEYEGEIKKEGNVVRVSQINRPTAQRKTVGQGHEFFESTKLSTSYIDITADQVITASFEFDDLVELQSQIGSQDSKIRQSLLEACQIELNSYLYSKVAPSTSSPDHSIASVTDFNATQMANARKRASQAKWSQQGGWWCLADPQYMNDLLAATTLVSSDYVPDQPTVGGQIITKRFGFNILEDNSAGLIECMNRLGSSTATEDAVLLFHPDFMHLVMPKVSEFKIAELTSNKQFGYVIVVRFVVGAALGISGASKHQLVYNS